MKSKRKIKIATIMLIVAVLVSVMAGCSSQSKVEETTIKVEETTQAKVVETTQVKVEETTTAKQVETTQVKVEETTTQSKVEETTINANAQMEALKQKQAEEAAKKAAEEAVRIQQEAAKKAAEEAAKAQEDASANEDYSSFFGAPSDYKGGNKGDGVNFSY